MLQPPCYDPRVHTDCPQRSAFCRLSCAKWQAFEKEKAEYYARREKEYLQRSSDYEYQRKIHEKFERRKHKK